jgi:hypothetical protein
MGLAGVLREIRRELIVAKVPQQEALRAHHVKPPLWIGTWLNAHGHTNIVTISHGWLKHGKQAWIV